MLRAARGLGATTLAAATRRAHLRCLSASAGSRVFGGASACDEARATLDAWHSAVDASLAGQAGGIEVLRPRMDPQCVFRPPTYFKPWTGRDEALMLLGAVSEVFGPSFRYGRQWISNDGRDWALEFEAEIGQSGKRLQGIDLVNLNEAGLIAEFTVLARPPNAVGALKEAMMRKVPVRLAALKAKQALGLT